MVTLRKALRTLSIFNLYIVVFCSICLLQEYTIGLIPWFRYLTLYNTIYVHDVIFALNALVITVKYVKVYPPSY
ncbi:MAG: hypothetical protein PWR22_840 [Moorella sp. (in: firmicutes)]|nr:hypothetical protein [Moorella sp. (in: firmicutes)]